MEYQINTLNNPLQNHLLPMVAGIATGSLLTWSDPRGLAIALIAQKTLSIVSNIAVENLHKQFPHVSLSAGSKLALGFLGTTTRAFIGHHVALLAGLPTPYLAIIFANCMRIETNIDQGTVNKYLTDLIHSVLPEGKNVVEVPNMESDIPNENVVKA